MSVAVIGGGLAGLTSACALADAGHQVTLFEARPWCGGKTYSFRDRATGASVDNGQHIFMRCCTAYIGFLRRLGTLGLTKRQRRLRVPVFDGSGVRSDLWAAPLSPPLHLLPSFAGYRHLSAAEKLRIAAAIAAIQRLSPSACAGLSGQSFGDWLRRQRQTEREIRNFWDLIVVPALNCRSDEASAGQALFIFQAGFLRSPEAAAIGVPRTGLSELHVEPAVRYLRERGGEVRTSCAVKHLEFDAGAVILHLAAGVRRAFDACICAIPPRQVAALLPAALNVCEPFRSLRSFQYAPIVNLHCWFDGPVAPFDFAAFTGSDIQWIFNRTRIAGDDPTLEEHLVLSLSAASRFMALERGELRALFLPQLQRALSATRGRRLLRFLAIKEPEATFIAAPGLRRPAARTLLPNFVLAGAYTDTGWPATMESAVRSGLSAARALLATPAVVGARRSCLPASREAGEPAS